MVDIGIQTLKEEFICSKFVRIYVFGKFYNFLLEIIFLFYFFYNLKLSIYLCHTYSFIFYLLKDLNDSIDFHIKSKFETY